MIIDSHTHIYLPEFEQDHKEVIERAVAAGVEQLILPNVDLTTLEPMQQLCAQYPSRCLPAIGLHPTSVDENYQHALNTLKKELTLRPYCAIGEIGIDLYWDNSYQKQQEEAFAQQIAWGAAYHLPLIIHTRNSMPQTIAILRENQQCTPRGIFHSYTGNAEEAEEIAQLGDFYFGVNGIVTFKNSQIAPVIQKIGLEKLVLETDAPYLTPTPHRGKRNEPAYLPLVVKKLAELFECSPQEVMKKTTQNSREIFAI